MRRLAGFTVMSAVTVALTLSPTRPLPGFTSALATPAPPELPTSFVVCQTGKAIPLQARVTYQASQFPIPLRLTPPDSSWSGGQWKTGSSGCDALRIHYLGQRPYMGWVAIGQGVGSRPPRGSILIMTSYGPTPPAAVAVSRLRAGLPTNGVIYQPTAHTRLSGFSGYRFDGKVVADHHFFLPFTPPGGATGGGPDSVEVKQGWVFRIIVLDVRGKTVVIYIANVALPPSQFPAFLNRANQIVKTLTFPQGR